MFKVMGKEYFIDIDEIIKKCRPDYGTKNVDKRKKINPSQEDDTILELNVFKFEIYKACLERILNEYENEIDENLGVFSAEKSMGASFKIAFNTLLKYDILIENDDDDK